MFHRLLVALDCSPLAERVLNEAIDLARATSSDVLLVHVLSSEEEGAPQATSISVGMEQMYPSTDLLSAFRERWAQYETACLDRLKQYADSAKSKGVAVECTQQAGSAGRMICDIASAWNADLIVMGRHGRLGLEELLMGSVSNYVTHHAHCAVLVLGLPSDSRDVGESNLQEFKRETISSGSQM